MQLKCSRNVLTAGLQVVNGVVPSRTPREILRNVKLQVRGNSAVLLATDGDGIAIRYSLNDLESSDHGDALLPTNRLLSILRELTDDAVTLEFASDKIEIRCGGSEFRLTAEDPADFPPVVDFDENDYFVIPSATFRQMVKRTIFATDTESTRYALGGVLLELTNDQVRMAATDSRRLAVTFAPCSVHGSPTPGNAQPVVPSKAMAMIERSLSDGVEEVHVAMHQNDVVVRSGPAVISSQLVQGRFPDYKKVIPPRAEITLDLVVGPFHSVIRQSQIVTSNDSRGVDFTLSKGFLRLSSQAADVGQSKVELPVAFDGPELTITFDPRYVGDFLKVLDAGAAVQFKLINDESPGVLTTTDDYTYVVMPLSRDR